MYWKRQGGTEYLVKCSPKNAQRSLGPRSQETTLIYEAFTKRKEVARRRLADLTKELARHQRMNRALHVGRAPKLLVDILHRLYKSGLAEHFTVVGTHALYAYETAAGVRVGHAALATRDIDLLWDTRKRITFVSQMETLGLSMLGFIRKVDPTFEIREDQRYTAVNSKGFEVDIIRREVIDGDPHPLRLTDTEDEFFAVQAKRAGVLLSAPRFSSMIVSTSGHMARMNTVSPVAFANFKRWMAERPDRAPLKRQRDILQATLVDKLVEDYLPHLLT
ncbi:MAG: hypothetical protein IH614_09360 [Desulfuromonadales bacterium]|nr:hypothetical protein [Desulfuromonadales bacterium]